MNEVIDIRQHRAEIHDDSDMAITLLAVRWARARDARLLAAKVKRQADSRGVLYALHSCADTVLAEARREESRAKRQLLAACKALMQRQQLDVIDV